MAGSAPDPWLFQRRPSAYQLADSMFGPPGDLHVSCDHEIEMDRTRVVFAMKIGGANSFANACSL
jgi:hypothetical protein